MTKAEAKTLKPFQIPWTWAYGPSDFAPLKIEQENVFAIQLKRRFHKRQIGNVLANLDEVFDRNRQVGRHRQTSRLAIKQIYRQSRKKEIKERDKVSEREEREERELNK